MEIHRMHKTFARMLVNPALRPLAVAAVSVAGAVMVAPAAASAAAPWSTAVTISAAHGGVGPVGLTSTDTSTVAWWRWQDGFFGAGATFGDAVAARPAGTGSFGPERLQGSDELISLDVQGYGSGRLLALSQALGRGPVRAGKPNPPDRVLVSTGGPTGLRAPTTLARANLIGAPQLGVAPSGRAVVAFASYDPEIAHRVIVSAARRAPSSRFSRPEVISGRGEAHGVVAAIGRRGDMVVAFVRNKQVVARVRRPGHGWGSIQTLATADGPTQWTLRAAVSDAGAVQVLWHRRFVSDRMDGAALQTRRMGPAASRWGARSTLEPIGATSPSALVAVAGGFAVAYTVRDAVAGSPSTPRVSIVKPSANRTLDVAAPSPDVRDVRLAWSGSDGLLATMVVLPSVGAASGLGVGAFLAPGAAGFGPIETIAPAGNMAPGFDRDGVPLVVWSAPADPSVDNEVRAVVRTSARTG
jgi:hypothetical protein